MLTLVNGVSKRRRFFESFYGRKLNLSTHRDKTKFFVSQSYSQSVGQGASSFQSVILSTRKQEIVGTLRSQDEEGGDK